MRKKVILITGANGEVGHGLIRQLAETISSTGIVVLDIRGLDVGMHPYVNRIIVGDILDTELLDTLQNEYEIDAIFHLAALLSTHSEFHPEAAHRVNVQGTVNLLKLAVEQGQSTGDRVRFIYPSSIAVYGLPDLETKHKHNRVKESEFLNPTTMYGCNKLYCEHLGRYYASHYQQLSKKRSIGVDFRCVRFPGLISAITMPSGGTSDYAPEMIHAAAQGKPYRSFVRKETTIPFMVMPDAIKALLNLYKTPEDAIRQRIYNVSSFSYSAGDFSQAVRSAFPDAEIQFGDGTARQNIVDTWPADIDDSAARADWGWHPDYDDRRAFEDYLIPTIQKQYSPLTE